MSSRNRLQVTQTALLLIGAHIMLWTLVPLLINRNLPLDVVEALAWGREWQWGYYKHPPLSGWLAELFRIGPHDASLYFLAQVMTGGALIASWLLARDLFGAQEAGEKDLNGERLALAATLALEGIHYYNFSSLEFNANVVMYPAWAWASLCFWKAVRPYAQNKPADSASAWGWWLGLGVAGGLGLLGKYVFALLPASLLMCTLVTPALRKTWRTPGPWLALVTTLLIFAPHLHWAITRDWPTLHYAIGRGHAGDQTATDTWSEAFITFVLTQLLALSPMFVLMRLLGPTQQAPRSTAERSAFIALGLGPSLMIMMAATITHTRMIAMWATPFFLCAAPLWWAWRSPFTTAGTALHWRRFGWGGAVWITLLVTLYVSTYLFGPAHKHRLDRVSFPGKEIAQVLAQQWAGATHGAPLRIVAGEEFVAGSVAHYAKDRPSVFYDADFSESLWLDDHQVRRNGALFVWLLSRGETPDAQLPADSTAEVEALRERYPTLEKQPTLIWQTTWMGHPYKVAIAWAILPPSAQ